MTTPSQYYQFELNGWSFGGIGNGVQVLSIDGLEDLPSLRVQDETRGYQDGMLTGRDFLNARVIVMELQIMSDANNPFTTYLAQAKANLISQTSGVSTLKLYLPGRTVQVVYGRIRRRNIRIDPQYTYGKATAHVEFFCPDPRIYNDTQSSLLLNPITGRLRTYNRTYNLAYTATSAGAYSGTVTNAGNYETWPTFTLTGTMNAPVITNTTTGEKLSFPLVSLTGSDTLVVNSDLRTVTLNGASARNLLSTDSTWFSFDPGVTTSITASVASGTGLCTINYRDAYI
jgi:hypothetical protein